MFFVIDVKPTESSGGKRDGENECALDREYYIGCLSTLSVTDHLQCTKSLT